MFRSISLGALLLASLSGAALAQDPVPVSGSFNYTPDLLARIPAGGSVFVDAVETEVWSGDIAGTAVSPFRMVITPDGAFDAWILGEFEGAVLGTHEGTLTMITRYTRPAATAHWTGEWMILGGTGDLEGVHGHGTAWGPGNNPDGPEDAPEIYYAGEVMIPAE